MMGKAASITTLFLLSLLLLGCGLLPAGETPGAAQPAATSQPKAIIPGPTGTATPAPLLQPTPTLAPLEPTPTAAATATETAVPQPTESTPLLLLSVPAANVRSGPGMEYAVIGVVREGESVPVLGASDGGAWIEISLPAGGEGWVGSSVAAISGP